jgi:hypothetical protein
MIVLGRVLLALLLLVVPASPRIIHVTPGAAVTDAPSTSGTVPVPPPVASDSLPAPIPRRRRILLVSSSDRPTISAVTFPRMREYAERRGYDHFLDTAPLRLEGTRAPAWRKLQLLLRFVDERNVDGPATDAAGKGAPRGAQGTGEPTGPFDYVLWLDDDIYITNLDTRLETFIDRFVPHKHKEGGEGTEADTEAEVVVNGDAEPLLLIAADAFSLMSRSTKALMKMPLNTGAIFTRCVPRTAAVLRLLWDAGPALRPRSLSTSLWEQDVFTLLFNGISHVIARAPGRTLQSLTVLWATGDFALHAAGLPLAARATVLGELRDRAASGEFSAPDARHQRFENSADMLSSLVRPGTRVGVLGPLVHLPWAEALLLSHRPRTLVVVDPGLDGGAMTMLAYRAVNITAASAQAAGLEFFMYARPAEAWDITLHGVSRTLFASGVARGLAAFIVEAEPALAAAVMETVAPWAARALGPAGVLCVGAFQRPPPLSDGKSDKSTCRWTDFVNRTATDAAMRASGLRLAALVGAPLDCTSVCAEAAPRGGW